jgi:hypothetical protein
MKRDKLGRGVMQFKKGKLTKWKGKGIETIIRNGKFLL